MTTNRVNDQLEIVLEHNLIASHLDIHEKNIREAILRNTGVKMGVFLILKSALSIIRSKVGVA